MGSQVKDFQPDGVWEATLNELKMQMVRATFDQWLQGTKLAQYDPQSGMFHVAVSSDRAVDWLSNRLADTINRTLTAVAGRPAEVRFFIPPPTEDNGPALAAAPNRDGRQGIALPEAGAEPAGRFTPSHRPGRRNGDAPTTESDDEGAQVRISYSDFLPSDVGYVAVSHYALRFWRPFLGAVAFDLLMLLDSYAYDATYLGGDWPTIGELSRKLGIGSRHTILGRNAGGGKPAIKGAAQELEGHGLVAFYTEKNGRRLVYHFHKLVTMKGLPLLTSAQVATLSETDQNEHRRWLKRYEHVIDTAAWERDGRPTAVKRGAAGRDPDEK